MDKYNVKCLLCGEVHDPYSLNCKNGDESLLRAYYTEKQLIPTDMPGIWKFYNWLPVDGIIEEGSGKTVTYKSEALASELELDDLWIAFNGYWPEKGADLMTCTFKDLESFPTMQRLKEQDEQRIMVVASAGNTARAFANVCSITGQPLLLVVPKESVHRLWTIRDDNHSICLVTVEGDYFDAISLAGKIAARDGFVNEGGAKNVARRDGMGTVMLDAVLTSGKVPDHYFQAVGSGTGGISAWEASLKLLDDGRFGETLPKLHLGQSLPCAPLYSLWKGVDAVDAACPDGMYDDVLFNRKPPYALKGGVKDVLEASGGDIYAVTNEEASAAQKLFEKSEGIDLNPAAAVAVATLVQAIEAGTVKPDEKIVLNITGGGQKRLMQDYELKQLPVSLEVSAKDEDAEDKVVKKVAGVFGI
ncbi:cysteate synthase [Methanolobus vulcani]|uniref:Cysteate synthase n=1 Tax=Methanolobus vulcani TaxID=38026 RepID=A0A7Z7B0I1_9EURY|nr:cysteate synthase [Methanolobus vulcani]SDF51815.1 cysteate synthase [Methanolobus vulcani]